MLIFVYILIWASSSIVWALPRQLKIGILLHEQQLEQEIVFKWSIDHINRLGLMKKTKLHPLIKRVAIGDSWDTQKRTCELLNEGAIAILGPTDVSTSQHVASICDSLDVPHFSIVTGSVDFESLSQDTDASGALSGESRGYGSIQELQAGSSPAPGQGPNSNPWVQQPSGPPQAAGSPRSMISVDLSISKSVLVRAYIDVLHALNWKNFVYIYEKDDSLLNLQEYLTGQHKQPGNRTPIPMKILRFSPTQAYRQTFRRLRESKVHRIVLDVACENLRQVLKHAQQVSMMTESHSYMLVCLDTQTLELEDFKYSRAKILWLNSIQPFSEPLQALLNERREALDRSLASMARYNGQVTQQQQFEANRLQVACANIHDAIMTIALAMQGVDASQRIEPSGTQVSCSESRPWPHGSTVVNHIRTTIEFDGITGRVRFDPFGFRSNFSLNIVRLTEDGTKIIGNWSEQPRYVMPSQLPTTLAPSFAVALTSATPSQASWLQQQQQLPAGPINRARTNILLNASVVHNIQRDPLLDEADQRDILVVVSIRNDPYFMMKQTANVEVGNSRYEGYAVDLIDEISKIVGFQYVFKEVDDGIHGKYDPVKREWNGMIREVMIGKADLAIADLSITASREDAVDFTLPFMSTGITLLFKKPTTKELELFSFLSPFENNVWFYVACSYIGISLLLFVVGRISPYEWENPHPCRQEGKILRNQFSIKNSFWFTMAAVMQQGSDMEPRSLSTRLVSAFWYFFTLIMISSYTANLAAFLTVEKIVYPIEKAEDLYNNPHHIAYGCLSGGSTDNFFAQSKKGSVFKAMSDSMIKVKSNDEGIARVEAGNYAYFMESTSIEYTIERQCNLTHIGGLLDSKGYGIAVAKNSTRKRDYRTKLSEAILSLQESGILEVLRNRWWKEKRGGGACDIEDSQGGEGVKNLTLKNVGGVFAILIIGVSMGFIICALEIFYRSYELSKQQGTDKWKQVKRRIAFALDLGGNY